MDKEELIRRRAYDIWCAEGWPRGRDQEHWEQACREVEAETASDPTGMADATVAEANEVQQLERVKNQEPAPPTAAAPSPNSPSKGSPVLPRGQRQSRSAHP
jgi:hypothetical protein